MKKPKSGKWSRKFAVELKAARLAAKMTQAQAADFTGFALNSWQDWEQRRRLPAPGMQRLLIDKLASAQPKLEGAAA